MKLAVAMTTPEVSPIPPVALLSGTFDQRLARAKSLGYDGVELMTMDPAILPAADIRAKIEAPGLTVAAVASGAVAHSAKLTLLHADASVRRAALRRFRDLITFAAQVGAPLVTVGSYRGWLKSVGQKGRDMLCLALRRACAWAGEAGIRVVLEPANRYELDFIATAQEGLRFIAQVDSPHLGLLLDTFHVNIEEASPVEAVRAAALAGKLWHVHLGDSNRLPPGQGHFDFRSFARALAAVGYDGYLSAELLARPDPDAAARATIEYMRQIVQRVKG